MKTSFFVAFFFLLLSASQAQDKGVKIQVMLYPFGAEPSRTVNKINSSLYLAIGYTADLNKQLSFTIETTYNRTLRTMLEDHLTAYDIGVGMGLGYHL